MPLWAIIFKPWDDEPVYHRVNKDILGISGVTRCGRKIGPLTPWLPFKHVVKFGRECKGCFS